jgi:glycosyltransferase involved in cell wall biosynthesis
MDGHVCSRLHVISQAGEARSPSIICFVADLPVVSVLLPTFNRASFLPAAIAAISAQTLRDWELIVVDDGSRDDTESVIAELSRTLSQPVRYVRQDNAGAYGARNRALDLATAPFVAFYDSDDVWLSHHLHDCVQGLQANPDVDWVYASCRIVDYATGATLDPDTFRINGQARPFQQLRTRGSGQLRILDDDGVVACAFRDGLYCGLQNSVIRRTVFERHRFQSTSRNEAEDQLFVIRSLKRGHRVAYIDAIHVQYHVHGSNSSAPNATASVERQLKVYELLARGFEDLRREFTWSANERRELNRRIGIEYFWHLGYVVLWNNGRRSEALRSFRRGLREWPWSASWWKTYGVSWIRAAATRAGAMSGRTE